MDNNESLNNMNKFMNHAAPLAYNMGNGVYGSYDNLKLKTPCNDCWKHPPCNPQGKVNPLFVPQGTPLPLKNEEMYQNLPHDSMFLFSNNYSSPACCPSTFSTDSGCVCSTEQQRKLVGMTRGNNKNHSNYGF